MTIDDALDTSAALRSAETIGPPGGVDFWERACWQEIPPTGNLATEFSKYVTRPRLNAGMEQTRPLFDPVLAIVARLSSLISSSRLWSASVRAEVELAGTDVAEHGEEG